MVTFLRSDVVGKPVQAWKPGYAVKRPGDLSLRLTEFAGPRAEAIYFRLQNFDVAVDDELLSGDKKPSP